MTPSINRPCRSSVALTIAGSDSGGGAGIQADLKAFQYFKVHGTSAITAVTAQNPHEVGSIFPLSGEAVAAQIRLIFAAFDVAAVKTGMLFNSEIIEAVAAILAELPRIKLVVDPVMVATSGARLLKPEAIEIMRRRLLPEATVITPNIPETEALCSITINSAADAIDAAVHLAKKYASYIIVKGGHRSAKKAMDILSDGKNAWCLSSPMIQAATTHGTGCMLSAALTANLAKGCDLLDAVKHAKAYVSGNLEHCVTVGSGTYAANPPDKLPLQKIKIEQIA